MKDWLIGIGFLGVLVLVACLLTFNVRLDNYSILIKLEEPNQIVLLEEGHKPETVFVSLKDTPIADSIKVLTVSSHLTLGGPDKLGDQIVEWLDSIGVTSYQEVLIR